MQTTVFIIYTEVSETVNNRCTYNRGFYHLRCGFWNR
jgi:hypothetical protein